MEQKGDIPMKEVNKYKRILQVLLPAATLISLFFVPWILIRAWIMPLPDTVQEQVDQATELGFDGIIVYVDQEGEKSGFYAAGWKNREEKIPADPHSLFKIASIGKLYDAVAVTKLVKNKDLSLDLTLGEFFPELTDRIEHAENITVRMLVQHQSGIPNYTDVPDYWVSPPQTSEETLSLVLDQPSEFEPGERYAYSNTNYLLLTKIMEKVLGYSKFQYIEEEILSPLELEQTFASIDDVDSEELMSGYYVGVHEDIKMSDYGSMVATAEDVGVFIRALNDGTLLAEGEEEIYSSLYEYGHTGLIPGYQSIAQYHEDIDAVVIQFVNTTDFDGYTWTVSEIVYNRILRILGRN